MAGKPDFIVIGAMKCATSSLHDQLGAQDGIFMTHPKEPCFFSDDAVFANGPDWYASLFAEAGEGALCGESSTHYTKLPTYPDTVSRMREAVPGVKLVYVMRNPLDRLVSHYIHGWTERTITVDIDQAVDRHPELTEYGLYAVQLEPFLDAYGSGAVLPVFFERLTVDPDAELKRICGFLGHAGPVGWGEGAGKGNESSRRLRKSPLRDALVWNPVSTFLRRRLVPRSVRDRVKGLWQMKERPELSADVRGRLEERFDRDLERLGAWLGIGLSCAGFRETVLREAGDWVGNGEAAWR